MTSHFPRYTKKTAPTIIPSVKITERVTDLYIEFTSAHKLESIAQETYSDPTLWWVILYANPQYSMEYDIEPGEVIRVPLPLNSVVNEIREQLNA